MSDMVLGAAITALCGAAATGMVGVIDWIYRDRRARHSLLAAFAADVDSICVLAERLGFNRTYALAARAPVDEAHFPLFAIRSEYGELYSALAAKLTLLHPSETAAIVQFYQRLKVIVDTGRLSAERGRETGERAIRRCLFMCEQFDELNRSGAAVRRLSRRHWILLD